MYSRLVGYVIGYLDNLYEIISMVHLHISKGRSQDYERWGATQWRIQQSLVVEG